MKQLAPSTASAFVNFTFTTPRACRGSRGVVSSPFGGLLCLLLAALAGPLAVCGQVDDFNDGKDTGWTRFDLSAVGLPPASYTFPGDGFGGKAYRIFSQAPPLPAAGPARAFSYHQDVTYNDFYAAVDVIAWDNSLNQAFGFLFHAGNIGLGQTDGYVLNYDPNQHSGGHGQFQINVVTAENPTTIGSAYVTLDPTHRYRFVLTADTNNVLTGRVYDLADLTTPLATISATDATYPSGYVGLFNFSRVGAADYTNTITGNADATFDNYIATTLANAPTNVAFPGTVASMPGWPEVVNRSPVGNAGYYPATNGIAFDTTTFTTNTINKNSIKLFLNGADVSSNLVITGDATNYHVAFKALAPDIPYNAAILVANSAGQTITNTFAFDTFSEVFLASPGIKVVEAEDYNFNSGQFQADPPPSGLDTNGVQVNGAGTPAGGYYEQTGTLGVDYFDYETGTANADHAYRSADGVGTQAGSAEIESADVQPPVPQNDFIRQKYATNGLPEYEVSRTEGGEWLNYTRVFAPTNYNVYLRVASTVFQHVDFGLVSGDPTTTNQTVALGGPFLVPNTGLLSTYRFVPLTDAQGNLLPVALGGTNTFRLTMADPRSNTTHFALALNYLVFVPTSNAPPAAVELQSAPSLAGPFAAAPGATVDTTARTITLPLPSGDQFYRLNAGAALRLGRIQIVNTNLVLIYGSGGH